MRARDVRAIGFCAVTIIGLFAAVLAVTRSVVVALGLTCAYASWLLTRARMIRVIRRLRGDPDWSGYFENGGPVGGARLKPRAPAGSAANPRPAEPR